MKFAWQRIQAGLPLIGMLVVAFFFITGQSGCETVNTENNSSYNNDYESNDRGDSRYDRSYDDDRGSGRDYERIEDRDRNDRDRSAQDRMYAYDYYPKREIYFNRSTGEYTYWNNGKRYRDNKMPDFVRDNMGRERVSLRLRGTEPERFHDRIKRDYPPGGNYNNDRDRDREDRFGGAKVYGSRRDARPFEYYPNRAVLLDVSSREYFYQNNGKLVRSRELPDFVRKQMGSRNVKVFIAGNEPDRYLSDLQRDYPERK